MAFDSQNAGALMSKENVVTCALLGASGETGREKRAGFYFGIVALETCIGNGLRKRLGVMATL